MGGHGRHRESAISYGINGNVVCNMYENAKSCVKKGQTISNVLACNVGVYVRERISHPLLFAIYLNDFDSFVSCNYNGL